MIQGYIAKVIDRIEAEDCVEVMFLGASTIKTKVRVLHDRATPLYGTAGNLPDVGETGIVIGLGAYGSEYFWLGSFHHSVENICSTEQGKVIKHHESGVWKKIDKDGNIEISHPSGTFIKIGSNTTLSQRTRFKRKNGSHNLKESVNYDDCQQEPINVYLEHVWATDSLSEAGCSLDNRKSKYSGTTKKTKIKLSSSGVITVTHDTIGGEPVILTITAAGAVTLTTPSTIILDAEGDITIDTNGEALIKSTGKTTINASGEIELDGSDSDNDIAGVVTGKCICPLLGAPHIDESSDVKASK